MVRKLLAILIIAGASAYPHDEDPVELTPSTLSPENIVHPERGPLEPEGPERDLVDSEGQPFVEGPVSPEWGPLEKGPQGDLVNPEGHFNPEREQLSVENGPVPTDIPEEAGSQNDPKSEDSDLKTDATFWWPFYRSWGSWGYPSYRYRSYWSYPTYRTYWTYPTYRYYRPRTYYRYYYW